MESLQQIIAGVSAVCFGAGIIMFSLMMLRFVFYEEIERCLSKIGTLKFRIRYYFMKRRSEHMWRNSPISPDKIEWI